MFFKRAKQGKSKSGAAETAAAQPEASAAAPPPDAQASSNGSSSPLPNLDAKGLDPKTLGFETTADLEPGDGPVGQARALNALAFGAGMKGPGYNILVTGNDALRLRRLRCAPSCNRLPEIAEKPADWVYVSSFDPTGGFRALKLPAGTAKAFAEGWRKPLTASPTHCPPPSRQTTTS